MNGKILFFADRLPPLIGGMEMHGAAFLDYFSNRITTIDDKDLDPSYVFFNSGRWIEEMREIRKRFPDAKFVYRTGGNEIIKAPLNERIPRHEDRQKRWVEILNETVDLLITNSAYTEDRLLNLGVTCPFFRSVGGVETKDLIRTKKAGAPTFFCAARFVPYKNHRLLIDTFETLTMRGHDFQLRLAGDGALLKALQLERPWIEFLGALSNRAVCAETASADFYVQMSFDQLTEVEGGSYLHTEGMGRSIIEAISAGTFLIAGNSGALAEIVSEDRGILLNREEPLADRIEELLINPPKRPEPTDQYSWEAVFKQYERGGVF